MVGGCSHNYCLCVCVFGCLCVRPLCVTFIGEGWTLLVKEVPATPIYIGSQMFLQILSYKVCVSVFVCFSVCVFVCLCVSVYFPLV